MGASNLNSNANKKLLQKFGITHSIEIRLAKLKLITSPPLNCIQKKTQFKSFPVNTMQEGKTLYRSISASRSSKKASTTINFQSRDYQLTAISTRPFKCSYCNYSATRNDHLKSHTMTHTGERPYECSLCKFKCARENELVMHTRTHTGEKRQKKFKCTLCDYTAVYRCHIRSHMVVHSEGAHKKFPCQLCSKSFPIMSRLRSHIRWHIQEKPYNCQFCKRSFRENKTKHLHEKICTRNPNHGDKAWMERQKTFKCSFCSFSAIRRDQVRKHIRVHTGEKPYSCSLCNFRCSSNSDLKAHISRHTGEKPNKCRFCKYCTSDASNLKVHLRTHTGEKPFACSFCKYRSGKKYDLLVHTRLHTGEKPYPCDFCQLRFISSGRKTNHLKICKKNPNQSDPNWVEQQKKFTCTLCDYATPHQSSSHI